MVQWLRTHVAVEVVWVPSLLREPRSHVSWSS